MIRRSAHLFLPAIGGHFILEKYDAWLNVIITTGGIFFTVFVVIIPVIVIGGRVCYRKTGKRIDCSDFWGFAALGAGAFLAVCTIALFMLTLIVRDGMFFMLGVVSVVGIVCCLLWVEESGDDDLEIYFKVVVSGLGIFVALGFVLSLPGYAEKLKAEQTAEDAQYNQNISYYIGANNQKLEGDTRTYPVTSVRTNREGTSYSWAERADNGAFNTRTVDKVPDERYEVTIKDDLPTTDTEPRVERSVEYRVKGDDASAGKEVCVEKYSRGDLGILPICDKDKVAAARFVKTRTVIHIPAGSMDKMVTVTSE